MDIIIEGPLSRLLNALECLGFETEDHRTYYAAILKQPHGRYHALIKQLSVGKIYCDLHYDSKLHFLAFGVDYLKRPRDYYEHVLSASLSSQELKSGILGGFGWLSRKNRAIIKGLRL
jgi:hypothetical protein